MANSNAVRTDDTFLSFNLDDRILKALSKQKLIRPTPVQANAIPKALKGKDILAKARTGSGKTAAYSIPIIQQLVTRSAKEIKAGGLKSLILVPTRELCSQIRDHFLLMCQYCSGIEVLSLGDDQTAEQQQIKLKENPTIIISTPSRLAKHIEKKNVSLDTVSVFVIDEADLILSPEFGFEKDVKKIASLIPRTSQSFIMSATLDEKVEALKQLVLRHPVVLKITEKEGSPLLKEYSIKCPTRDRFLIAYALVRLKVLSGKTIFFTSSIKGCYQLKLFFDVFSIPSGVLNSELPLSSRNQTINSFNKGLFPYLIATDESIESDPIIKEEREDEKQEQMDKEEKEDEDEPEFDEDLLQSTIKESLGNTEDMEDEEGENDDEEEEDEDEDKEIKTKSGGDAKSLEAEMMAKSNRNRQMMEGDEVQEKAEKKKEKKSKGADKEYGVIRGIDFKDVSTVVNFDFPTTLKSYIHRIGRTARGIQEGVALSFVRPREEELYEEIGKKRAEEGASISPYTFNTSIIEGFRYRVEDGLRKCSKSTIKAERINEIQAQILNSKKIKTTLSTKSVEMDLLNEKAKRQKINNTEHLSFIPDYLLPSELAKAVSAAGVPKIGKPIEEQTDDRERFHYRKGKRVRTWNGVPQADPNPKKKAKNFFNKKKKK